MANEIITKKDIKDIEKAIDIEIKKDYAEKLKKKLIQKKKEIRMIEITLEKAKEEYKNLIENGEILSEEEYLLSKF